MYLSLNRRSVVLTSLGAATVLFASSHSGHTQTEAARFAAVPSSAFVEPEVRRSRRGILDTTLSVVLASSEVGGELRQHRSYEGALTGPTLRVKPGDQLRINLINRLPEHDPTCEADPMPHNGTHCVNTTNLHTHGLHVSPTGNSDNVLLRIEPGESRQYEISIPDDHPAGTFWYHAHKHGAVAAQLQEGMAGALIVEGDIDALPAISAAKERLLVFQQLRIPYEDGPQQPTTVNGVVLPRLTAQPGEVQRWRLVHAGISETLNMQVKKCAGPQDTQCDGSVQAIYQIAADGITIGKLHTPTDSYFSGGTDSKPLKNTLVMQPGYRADILVQLEAGHYVLVKNARSPAASLRGVDEEAQFLARIEVSEERKQMALPSDEMLAGLAPFEPVRDNEVTNLADPRKLVFNKNEAFNDIDGEKFDPGRIDQTLALGDVEEWHLTSALSPHPFHIHVNPFQIVSGDDDNPGFWKDTVIVRGDKSEIRIRTRYEVFTGQFVLHCHILSHEDNGMMQLVEIFP